MANIVNAEIVRAVKQFITEQGITNKVFGNKYLEVSESYICNILANREVMKLEALGKGLKEDGFELVITATIKKL